MLKTKLVGILNITPDSFTDGGEFFDSKQAITHTKQLIKDGADIIDIGAESTRPGATILSPEQELERLEKVLPQIIQIIKSNNCKSSLDTRHTQSAKYAIDKGIDIINDVSGASSPQMIETIANSNAQFVVMHSLTIPADKNEVLPKDLDIIEYLNQWFEKKLNKLEKAGISKNRIIFDPGVGFGKDASQSIEILKRINELENHGCEILIGHSRKSFIPAITGTQNPIERDVETLAASIYLVQNNVDYLRVHNVDMHSRALKVYNSLQ